MRISPDVRRTWVTIDDSRWAQAHASSVARAGSATLVTWFAGTREGTPDNQIWLTRRSRDDDPWSPPTPLTNTKIAHWNPVLTLRTDGRLWLFYKEGSQISTWTTWVRTSPDAGVTWSEPARLVDGDRFGRGPSKNPPLQLDDGTWLAPGSRESWDKQAVWDAFVDTSPDGGSTWTVRPIPLDRSALRGAGVIQPALWRSGDVVLALMRSTEGYAFRSYSTDGGFTWAAARPTNLPNNNSGLAAVALPDGRVACVHNPVAADWGPRCPLVVSISEDEGVTWRVSACLEDGKTPIDRDPRHRPQPPRTPAASTPDRDLTDSPLFAASDDGVGTSGLGEYSYPAALVVDEPRGPELLVTYTWQRRGIVEARVPLEVL